MAVRFSCPHCDKRLVVQDEFVGKKISCPSCKRTLLAPELGRPDSEASLPSADSNAQSSDSSLDDFLSQLSSGHASDSNRTTSPHAETRKPHRLLYFILSAALCLALGIALWFLFFFPKSPAQQVLGIWQFEKETGGMFSKENSKGAQVTVEFLPGGKMVMHNWRESLEGTWKMDDSTTPPSFDFNWMSGSSLDHFAEVKFPSDDVMLLKRTVRRVKFNATGKVTREPAEVTFHFRRRHDRPKPHSKERLAEIDRAMADQKRLEAEISNAPETEQNRLRARIEELRDRAEQLKRR